MAVSVNASDSINRKSRNDIKIMRISGRIVAEVHALMREHVRPGISTGELDAIAEAHIRKSGALPTFKGYHGFPATICASVNEEVVHGIPSNQRILNEGDVISVDVGATYRGMVADAALTLPVGTVDAKVLKLLEATHEGLMAAILMVREGKHLEDVSGAVEDVCAQYSYGLVREYGGHSVGYKLHEEPFIHNYRTGVKGPILKQGNCLAIEPMFNLGGEGVQTLGDEWTVVTKDGLPSAHFEHTVLVTEGDPEILTLLASIG
jgi:methionyl aminopeptidase